MTTQPGGKMAPSLGVVAEKVPLVVARRSFGFTKLLSSRLDWRIFSHNSDDPSGVNRPKPNITRRSPFIPKEISLRHKESLLLLRPFTLTLKMPGCF